MKQKLKFFIIGSLFFLAFVLFSFVVHKDVLVQFDFNSNGQASGSYQPQI